MPLPGWGHEVGFPAHPNPLVGRGPATPPQGHPGKRHRADCVNLIGCQRPHGDPDYGLVPSPGACGSFHTRSTTSRGLCAAPNDKSRIPLGTRLRVAYCRPASRIPPQGGPGSNDRTTPGMTRERPSRQRFLPPCRHHRAPPRGCQLVLSRPAVGRFPFAIERNDNVVFCPHCGQRTAAIPLAVWTVAVHWKPHASLPHLIIVIRFTLVALLAAPRARLAA